MTIDLKETWEKVLLFFINIGKTLKKSFIWLVLSYIIPLVNIFILWSIRRDEFDMDLSIISILVATNSCIITSLLHLFYMNVKKRETIFVVSIITIIAAITLFSLSTFQLEQNNNLIEIDVYQKGAYLTLIVSTLLLIISKYDEVDAESNHRADKGKKTDSAEIDGKTVKL